MLTKRQILFDVELHKYTDEFGNHYTSVTQLLSKIDPEFDTEFWSMYRAIDQLGVYSPRPFPEERKIEVKDFVGRVKYSLEALYAGVISLGRDPGDIAAEWKRLADEACARGDSRHGYLEHCVNRISTTNNIPFHDIQTISNKQGFAFKVTNLDELDKSPLAATYPTIYSHIKALILDGWVAYAEKRVYSPDHLIAGTIDLLFIKGKYMYIMDWKTNRKQLKFVAGYYKKEWNADRSKKIETDIFVRTNDKLLHPLAHLPACKGIIYTLQISLYLYLCELWGFEYAGSVLCQIRPQVDDNNEVIYLTDDDYAEHEPEFFNLQYMRNEVQTLMDWHKSSLTNSL